MSENGQQDESFALRLPRMKGHSQIGPGTSPATARIYQGWLVVGAAFLVAVFGFGLGFYGPGVYLVALQARHGWSTAAISSAITTYYLLGATLVFFAGSIFERFGARCVVGAGAVAMACSVALLALVVHPWQIFATFALMSVGWAAMSGAAINIIIACWFDRRRGLALSLALNGASVGGVIIAPLLVLSIGRFELTAALTSAAGVMLAVLLPVVAIILRPRRIGERDDADDISTPVQPPFSENAPAASPPVWRLSIVLRDSNFQTISIPFALGLTAQVGFLTHQIAYLSPVMGAVAAGWAVSLTTSSAVIGRIMTGFFIDMIDRRLTTCGNLCVQIAGMGFLASYASAEMLYLGCILFGLGVGNMTSLPGLLVQQEFPKQYFPRIVSLIVAINQFTFAFGPGLLGYLQRAEGSYRTALIACVAMQTAAAVIVILPLLRRLVRRMPRTKRGKNQS